jgi:hypothetical protein
MADSTAAWPPTMEPTQETKPEPSLAVAVRVTYF